MRRADRLPAPRPGDGEAARQAGGQSTIEYAVLIAVVVAALLLMQRYVKGAIAQRWRSAGDVFGFGQQYEPGVTQITKDVNQ
ncbi:MAG: hypothetical protein HY597_03680 [Candidatus Omnitrophica bacterium]|nr:hypothetical protein [Candidatus Omnitrophota bacterium]